jgi:hypothetical protein
MKVKVNTARKLVLILVLGFGFCRPASAQKKVFILDQKENIEEIILANLTNRAHEYGLLFVSSKNQADFILDGAAAFKQTGGFLDGYPCSAVYFFDVYRVEKGKRRKLKRFEGPDEETPCVRLVIANQILSKLKALISQEPLNLHRDNIAVKLSNNSIDQ